MQENVRFHQGRQIVKILNLNIGKCQFGFKQFMRSIFLADFKPPSLGYRNATNG